MVKSEGKKSGDGGEVSERGPHVPISLSVQKEGRW